MLIFLLKDNERRCRKLKFMMIFLLSIPNFLEVIMVELRAHLNHIWRDPVFLPAGDNISASIIYHFLPILLHTSKSSLANLETIPCI
jgi:hypothetical protein